MLMRKKTAWVLGAVAIGLVCGSRALAEDHPAARLWDVAKAKQGILTDGLAKRLSGKVNLSVPNVHVLPVKGDPKSLLQLPQVELDAMRAAILHPLGHTFRAPNRVALYLFADGTWVIENFRDETVNVELDGATQAVSPRGWLLHWTTSTPVTTVSRCACGTPTTCSWKNPSCESLRSSAYETLIP